MASSNEGCCSNADGSNPAAQPSRRMSSSSPGARARWPPPRRRRAPTSSDSAGASHRRPRLAASRATSLARVYDVYVGALCDKGDLAGARRMLGCMERAGCPPDVATFGVVVAGCVAAGDMDAAREVAREAIRRGLRWDAPALSELVGALRLRGGGHLARVRGVLLDILRDGCAAGLDASAFLPSLETREGPCPEAAVAVGGETPTSLQQLAIIPGN